MNKKIFIGSILVLTLLLLMPSISAIHINAIENEIKQKNGGLIAENPSFDAEFFPERLFCFVVAIAFSRFVRAGIWMLNSIEFNDSSGQFNVTHPLAYYRGVWLYLTFELWVTVWYIIFEKLGWDWSE